MDRRLHHSTYALAVLCALSIAVPQYQAQQAYQDQALPMAGKLVFQQIEDKWSEAVNKRDQYALELVLSPDLIDISATGSMTTRNQQIAMLLRKNANPLALDQRVVNAQVFGSMAVIVGTYVEQSRGNDNTIRRNGMFTHIYQNVRGTWLCIGSHRTITIEKDPVKPRDKTN